MSSRRRVPGPAPSLRESAAAIAARMGEASESGDVAGLERLMRAAAGNPQLAAAIWKTLAAELAGQAGGGAQRKPG